MMSVSESPSTPHDHSDVSALFDPVFLFELRKQMLKFATIQLRNHHQAEDAVQEALIGAMKNVKEFQHRAAIKTWVFSILKNKIIDIMRQHRNTIAISQLSTDTDDESVDMLFDKKGFWDVDQRPIRWESPQDAAQNSEFWVVFEACLDGLPESQARIFMLREFMDMDTNEICLMLNVTINNLHVVLYRARVKLRECLENRWFMGVRQ